MRVFQEYQRFDQWWFRLLLFFTILITVGSIIMAYPEIEPDEKNMFLIITIITMLIVFSITILGFFIKLETRIDETGIHYGFIPFQRRLRFISWEEIESCFIRKYSPISEFGGWGYKLSLSKRGKAYNVKGNIGLQIVFKNQKKTLLGTQKPEEVKRILQTYSSKFSNHEN